MSLRRPPIVLRYGSALLFIGVAVGVVFLVRYFFALNPTPILLLALVGAAWYGGRTPGLLAVVAVDLAVDYLFDETPYVLGNPSAHIARLMVLCIISLLTTSRKDTQDSLTVRERQQATVARFSQEALSSMPEDELLPKAVELVKATLDVDCTAICQVLPDGQKLCYTAAAGWDQNVIGYEFEYHAENSLAGIVLSTGAPVVIPDLKKDGRFEGSAVVKGQSIRSVAGVKIQQRDHLFGVLGAFERRPRKFTSDDINFLQSVASVISEATERLKAEAAVREQRTWLRTTLSSIGDGVIATDRAGGVMFMNPVAERLTGWNEDEAIGRPLDDVFRAANEETLERHRSPVAGVLETGSIVSLPDHTVLIAKDGSKRPIADTAAPIVQGNEIKGIVLVFADITERKLAEQSQRETETMRRLVEAQESERLRISRNIHDHLGQQMTALRLKVESLLDESTGKKEIEQPLIEIQQSALQIDRDIGFLSWELRPTELDQLGLENALGSYVREWSIQHGIEAEFQAKMLGLAADGHRLPQSTETNLYRIVQEALNNVLKHANANRVSVLLHQRNDSISLVVEDDGRGINGAVGVADTIKKSGLGLTGMQERTALMKGELEIESHPGEGTTILATIPYSSPE